MKNITRRTQKILCIAAVLVAVVVSAKYAAMLEGARGVGKSTIAEEFARTNFKTYIKIDFTNVDKELLAAFTDIANLGYLYENAAAQVIAASGNKLFYHTWLNFPAKFTDNICFLKKK